MKTSSSFQPRSVSTNPGTPGTESIRPYLLGTQFQAWQGFLRTPADWTPVMRAAWVCAIYAAGPIAAGWAVSARRARYRRAVEGGLAGIATALADGLAAGRPIRSALAVAGEALNGPPAAEMARLRADLELGIPTRDALAGLRRRIRSGRVDAFCAALLTHHVAGGDLAALLRRFAVAADERERIVAEARVATAQARFTGLLVVAMPLGVALLTELANPGFMGGLLGQPTSVVLLAIAGLLQAAGFVAIRRLGAVV